jgi:competence ComEA-like helix-hairpin-helix protein
MKRAQSGMLILIAAASLGAAADDEEAKALPDAPGKDVTVKVCLSCHGAGNIRKKRLTREGWTEQVADMVDRGAEATEAQQAAVVDYLTQTFGKGSKIHINTAPFEELRSVLGLSVEEVKAVLAYRKENGDFKSWQDLQKVPGVDAKKIETKKELIALE